MLQTDFAHRFTLVIIIFFFQYDHLLAQTNLCPTFSCNCTFTSSLLNIVCDSSASDTILPTLTDGTLHNSVTELHIKSAISSDPGPLIRLPTNLCSVYPNIQILDLSYNQINGLVNTSELACLGSRLRSIDLSHNFITEVNQNFFQANTQLEGIDFSYNNLTKMPSIDPVMFVDFPRTMSYMNFSFNAITSVDLWPLFVKTGTLLTIDMRDNIVSSFINEVPIYVKQFEETPDPRIFYLQNNRISRLSDYLVQQYGACATLGEMSTAYFVVGISNLLLTGNPLICDCDSYFLITYIQDRITQFPQISNGLALINQATCDAPADVNGQFYVSVNFNNVNCTGHALNTSAVKFCSIYANDTSSTLAPPNYWTSTTARSTTGGGNGNGGSGGSGSSSNNGGSNGSTSSTPAWYIILGIVLGTAIILAVLTAVGYWFREQILPEKLRSKLGIRGRKGMANGMYHPMFPGSDGSSPRGSHNDSQYASNLAQGTQTGVPIERVKASGVSEATPKRKAQAISSDPTSQTGGGARKLSASKAADVSTNTNNVVRGIPIGGASKLAKVSATNSNGNDTSTSELSVKSIPLGASKRAKPLPQVKSGMYLDTSNVHLLNTSAGGLASHQRQRRRSAAWLRKQTQPYASPLPTRPQSVIAQKTSFDHEGSFDQDLPPIPTMESLADKPPKPLRTLPLLNITVVPAWIGDEDAEVAGITGGDTMKKE